MVLMTGDREVSFEDAPGDIFEFVRASGLTAPEYAKLRTAYYGRMTMSTAQVAQFRRETQELLDGYLSRCKQEVIREKRVHARTPAMVDQIATRLLSDDAWLKTLRALLALCDDAIARSDMIVCAGD